MNEVAISPSATQCTWFSNHVSQIDSAKSSFVVAKLY